MIEESHCTNWRFSALLHRRAIRIGRLTLPCLQNFGRINFVGGEPTVSPLVQHVGRRCGKVALTRSDYEQLCKTIKTHGLRLKLNTVVSKLNLHEDFTDFYRTVQADRIKLFQVLKPNDTLKRNYDDLLITKREFNAFVQRHRAFCATIVAEDNAAMTNAYYILDSEGRFIDNRTDIKSPSLAQAGITVEQALAYVTVDTTKYWARYSA